MSFLAGGLRAGISRARSCASALAMLLALTVAIAPAVAVPAPANAASGRGEPMGGGLSQTPNSGGGTRAGMRSAPPTGQALAGTLDQMTGLAPAQVQLQDVCPAVGPGLARCAAHALVLNSTHKLVRPDVAHTRPLALARDRRSPRRPPPRPRRRSAGQPPGRRRISSRPTTSRTCPEWGVAGTRSRSSTHTTTRP